MRIIELNFYKSLFVLSLLPFLFQMDTWTTEASDIWLEERESRLLKDHSLESPRKILGHLDVIIDVSFFKNHPSLTRKSAQEDAVDIRFMKVIEVCLASTDDQNNWNLNECQTTTARNKKTAGSRRLDQTMTVMTYDAIQLALLEQTRNTHLVVNVLQDGNLPSKMTYFSDQRLTLLNDDQIYHVTLDTSGDAALYSIEATFTLICSPNNFGPNCGVQCNPPSSRHQCDQRTGELKCAATWFGKNCDETVFISHEQASKFIRNREKRANSIFEELKGGNIERECNEERCSYEEAREAFENNAATARFWRVYTDPDQCESSPCVQGQTTRCEDLIADYNCHCRDGYTGKNCQTHINLCQRGPCKNGATCSHNTPTTYICACQPGFRGKTCNINIDECLSNNCGMHGNCVDGVNSFTCACDPGFTGPRCDVDINECEGNPCQNGGNCSDYVAFHRCECPDNYEGINCENRINPCTKQPCLNGGACSLNPDYSFTCSCASEFTGQICEHSVDNPCTSTPCANEGSCYVIRTNLTNETSQSNPTTQKRFGCLCPTGYGGDKCQVKIKPCDLVENRCSFNATCVSLKDQYMCVCPVGSVGDMCQFHGNDSEALERIKCEESQCLNNARCIYFENETSCLCGPGFNGSRCENAVDYCESSPCNNGGTCLQVPGGFYCDCPRGYRGKHCEVDIDECSENTGLCRNGGTCINVPGDYECHCGFFHTGRFCQTEFDPCSSAPCQNFGTCQHDNQTGYLCNCLTGYGGNNCKEIIYPCSEFTNPCENKANCSEEVDLPSQAICTCTEEFYGRYCEKKIDHCAVRSNVSAIVNGLNISQYVERKECGENGVCVSLDNSFRCDCFKGYLGSRCQTEYIPPFVNCSSQHCQCPENLINQLHFHENNRSQLDCRYRQYDSGACKTVTCLKESCENKDEIYCAWNSTCLTKYLSQDASYNETSRYLCPVIEITLNGTKLPKDTTVESFCHKIRELSSYSGSEGQVSVHCIKPPFENSNVSIAVGIDSVTSQTRSIILASDIFQRLDKELSEDGDGSNLPASDLDPVFSAIVSMRFAESPSNLQNPSDNGEPSTSATYIDHSLQWFYIFIPVCFFVLVLIIVIVVLIQRRRRRQKCDIPVAYVPNPNASENVAGDQHAILEPGSELSLSSQSTPIKKAKAHDEFVNPIFAKEASTSAYSALESRPSVHDNPYVEMPYVNTAASNSVEGSPKKSVEESTINYAMVSKTRRPLSSQYEVMNSFSESLPDQNIPYEFAAESSPSHSIHERLSNRSTSSTTKPRGAILNTNTYEEIDAIQIQRRDNAYETMDLLSPYRSTSPTFKLSKDKGDSEEYEFASEMPPVGVPSPFVPRRSTKSEGDKRSEEGKSADPYAVSSSLGDSGIEVDVHANSNTSCPNNSLQLMQNSEDQEQDNPYQIPISLLPQKEDSSDKDTKLPEVYGVPRKASPV